MNVFYLCLGTLQPGVHIMTDKEMYLWIGRGWDKDSQCQYGGLFYMCDPCYIVLWEWHFVM